MAGPAVAPLGEPWQAQWWGLPALTRDPLLRPLLRCSCSCSCSCLALAEELAAKGAEFARKLDVRAAVQCYEVGGASSCGAGPGGCLGCGSRSTRELFARTARPLLHARLHFLPATALPAHHPAHHNRPATTAPLPPCRLLQEAVGLCPSNAELLTHLSKQWSDLAYAPDVTSDHERRLASARALEVAQQVPRPALPSPLRGRASPDRSGRVGVRCHRSMVARIAFSYRGLTRQGRAGLARPRAPLEPRRRPSAAANGRPAARPAARCRRSRRTPQAGWPAWRSASARRASRSSATSAPACAWPARRWRTRGRRWQHIRATTMRTTSTAGEPCPICSSLLASCLLWRHMHLHMTPCGQHKALAWLALGHKLAHAGRPWSS